METKKASILTDYSQNILLTQVLTIFLKPINMAPFKKNQNRLPSILYDSPHYLRMQKTDNARDNFLIN